MNDDQHYCPEFGCLYCMVKDLYDRLGSLKADNWRLATECVTLRRERVEIDAKIKKIEKKEKSVLKDTKSLLKVDQKQDKKMDKMKKGCK